MKISIQNVRDFGTGFLEYVKKAVSDVVEQKEGSGFGDDVITPEYDPADMKLHAKESSALAPSIKAMVDGTVGQGFSINPIINFGDSDIDEKIRNLIYRSYIYFEDKLGDPDSLFQKLNLKIKINSFSDISDDMVGKVKEYLKARTYADQTKAEAFFSKCTKGYSYLDFTRYLQYDFYRTGYLAFEVERNIEGDIRYLRYLPVEDVRVTPLGTKKQEVQIKRRVNPLIIDEETEEWYFRKIVVKIKGTNYYCKEFGDPRIISQKKGGYYEDIDALKREEGADAEAGNEVVVLTDGYGAYGTPSWASAVPEVLGTREASEYNWKNFRDGFMTRLAIIVKNAVLGEDTKKSITEYTQRAKGNDGQHKVLILEAHSDDDGKDEDIKFEDLSKNFQSDAFFLEYSKYNEETVAAQYGLSKIARGKSQDYNRSTAYASMEHDETMVYSPARSRWDTWITNNLLLILGLDYVVYESNAVPTTDYTELSNNLTKDVEKGIITPNEARIMKSKYYGSSLLPIQEYWGDQPLSLTLTGFKPGSEGINEISDNITEAEANAKISEELAAEASAEAEE